MRRDTVRLTRGTNHSLESRRPTDQVPWRLVYTPRYATRKENNAEHLNVSQFNTVTKYLMLL